MIWWSFRSYTPVAERRANARREAKKLAKKKHVSPVEITGRQIASTFWGKAWCDHLESYSDFGNRLPRGRAYVRNGSVVDLQIEAGNVTSLVSGFSLYKVKIKIKPLTASHWKNVKSQCRGQIGTLIELLQGKLSKDVMKIVTQRDGGMFPAPKEIEMSCSCPDWAGMCKHLAATLYGIGNRLDHQPELLFKLRQVDHQELVAQACSPKIKPSTTKKKTIAPDQLANLFGIELDNPATGENVAVSVKQVRPQQVTQARTSPRRGQRTKPRRRAVAAAGKR